MGIMRCCCTTEGCPHLICTHVVTCDNHDAAGALVEVAGPDSGSCVADISGRCCVCVDAAGDYTVTGTYHNISVTVPAHVDPGDAEVDVTVDIPYPLPNICFWLKRCDGAGPSRLVSASTPSGFTQQPFTPHVDSHVCYSVNAGDPAVSFPVTVTLTYEDCDGSLLTVDASADGPTVCVTNNIDVDITDDTVTVCVTGCGGALPGATVTTATGGGGTTGADGCVRVGGGTPHGPVTSATAGKARYASKTVTTDVDWGCCSGVTIALDPDADHVCCSFCDTPISKTWTLSTPCGTVTLTGGNTTGQNCSWLGCIELPSDCLGATTTAAFFQLDIAPDGGGGFLWRLSQSMPGANCDGGCTGGFLQWTCAQGPPGEGDWLVPLSDIIEWPFDCATQTFPVVLSGSLAATFSWFDPNCDAGTTPITVTNPCGGGFTLMED